MSKTLARYLSTALCTFFFLATAAAAQSQSPGPKMPEFDYDIVDVPTCLDTSSTSAGGNSGVFALTYLENATRQIISLEAVSVVEADGSWALDYNYYDAAGTLLATNHINSSDERSQQVTAAGQLLPSSTRLSFLRVIQHAEVRQAASACGTNHCPNDPGSQPGWFPNAMAGFCLLSPTATCLDDSQPWTCHYERPFGCMPDYWCPW